MSRLSKKISCSKIRQLIITVVTIAISSYSYGQKTIKVQMAPLKRVQIAGPHKVILPSHFEYLQLFEPDQRFAPDEPSSHSSIEYFFNERKPTSKLTLNWSLGLFRNHIKGDIVLNEKLIHFGKGNSHFGASSSLNFGYSLFSSNYKLEVFTQLGLGPLVTQFRNESLMITPSNWGINGYGITTNMGIGICTPELFRHFKIHLGTLVNLSFIKFKSLEIIDGQNQSITYTNLYFMTINKLPAFNFGLSYRLTSPSKD